MLSYYKKKPSGIASNSVKAYTHFLPVLLNVAFFVFQASLHAIRVAGFDADMSLVNISKMFLTG